MNEEEDIFQERIEGELNSPGSFFNTKQQKDYRTSVLQKETYEKIEKKDLLYQKFITKNYGSFDNFLKLNKILLDLAIFDPTTDYIVDVTIIKEDAFYKTNHISSQEIILENLSGVCSVWFTKKNGSTRRLNCTLDTKYMPGKEFNTRANFFSPMAGDRVGVWDINEQRWKSFYMNNVFKFVRDDTSGIE